MEQFLFDENELLECQKGNEETETEDNKELTNQDLRNICTALNYYSVSMEDKLKDCMNGRNPYAEQYKNYVSELTESVRVADKIWKKIITKLNVFDNKKESGNNV